MGEAPKKTVEGDAFQCASHHASTKEESDRGTRSTVATDEEVSASFFPDGGCSCVSSADELAAHTAIWFDWDDTLFPTRFIQKVVAPWMEERDVACLSDTPFYEPLSRHARLIEDVIRVACSLGHVCIVTLAEKSWVTQCAETYLPGLDLRQLLTTLSIPVMYARDFVKQRMVTEAEGEGGVSLHAIAKMKAMMKALRRFSATGSVVTNWISIGDSSAERDALMECAWSQDEEMEDRVLCKTVKFMKGPTAQELEAQLQVLQAMLPRVAFALKDQDIDVERDWNA